MAAMCCLLLAAASFVLSVASSNEIKSGPIAETPLGRIEGVFKTFKDGTYMQFHGVPYAKPPIGKRRFAPPAPITPWAGTWKANASIECIQVDHYDHGDTPGGVTKGAEDCLYLNIFTPGTQINPNAKRDVIVHFHSGALMWGSGVAYARPKPMMDKEIVFVTLNQRLGIFGFLSLEDRHLPGNLGMKDQVMALEWVRDNIRYFGGNPESVTITGLSAGGGSVHFHLLSPMSRGLFHRAISVSGTALDPWLQQENAREKAMQVGRALGCAYDNSKGFVRCLRSRSADQIVEVTRLFRVGIYMPFNPFGLVVDSYAEVPFLPEHPYRLLEAGKVYDVPWLASLTTGEGLYPVAQLAANDKYFDELEENFETYLPALLHYDLTVPKAKMSEVNAAIRKVYLKDEKCSKSTYTQIIQMASHRLFNVGMEQSIRLTAKAKKSPVYFYSYDYTAEELWSLPLSFFGYPEKYAVSHGDDMLMIFEAPMEPSERDAAITEFLINLWVEFAKNGKVTLSHWKPLSRTPTDPVDYLYIGGPDNIEMRKSQDLSNKIFWNALPIIENGKLFHKDGREEL